MIARLLAGLAVLMLAPSVVSAPCSPWEPGTCIAMKCLDGPISQYSYRPCADYDMDGDGDVDLLDLADWIIEHPGGH